jgi:hypothetical protein
VTGGGLEGQRARLDAQDRQYRAPPGRHLPNDVLNNRRAIAAVAEIGDVGADLHAGDDAVEAGLRSSAASIA